jgi:hypothetical protein
MSFLCPLFLLLFLTTSVAWWSQASDHDVLVVVEPCLILLVFHLFSTPRFCSLKREWRWSNIASLVFGPSLKLMNALAVSGLPADTP